MPDRSRDQPNEVGPMRNRDIEDPAEQGERGTQDEPIERRRDEDDEGDELVGSQR